MNSILKNGLVLLVGTAIGAYGGYVWTAKRYEQIMEEEAEEWRKTLNERKQKVKDQLIKDAEGIDEISAVTEAPVKKKETTKDRYKKIVGTMKYSNREDEEAEEEEQYKYSKMSRKEYSDEPYVISYDEYNQDMTHYDKLTLNYYEDDDTLTDDEDEVIPDVDLIVGGDSLTRFGEMSGDPEIVYVRNDKLQIDYEIIRLSRSYGETVLGFKQES